MCSFVYYCLFMCSFVYYCLFMCSFVYYCLFLCTFVYYCLLLCTFYFGHCIACLSSIYGFWLHLWYLHTFRISVFLVCYENISIYKELEIHLMFRGLWCFTPLSIIVQLYRGGHFYWCKKTQTYHKQLTNFITKCCIEYTPPWAGLELTTLVISYV